MFHVEQIKNYTYMILKLAQESIRDVKDFPKRGILFKDLTPVLQDAKLLAGLKDELVKTYSDKGITKVVGIESRGFILAPSVAMELGAGFVPARKPGKLPAAVKEVTYQKEYGFDTIQMHEDALTSEDIVLVHDDLLATGGTMEAAIKLIQSFNVKKIYINFVVELDFLEGRKLIEQYGEVTSLIHF
jgi:adenine phosphoribosyltransferase